MTRAQVRAFENAILELSKQPIPAGIDPGFADVQKRALESQLEEMNSDVKEYEALKTGKVTAFEARSLSELPSLLVKARIARGVTHKELAARLEVKEQQVQRWESNEFSGASLDNLKAIADALGVVFTQQLFVPRADVTPRRFFASLSEAGLSPDFIMTRIIPSHVATVFRQGRAGLNEIVNTASTVSRIFGLKLNDVVEMRVPQLDFTALAATRFKVPARVNKRAVGAYTVYAHYLSALLVSCVEKPAVRDLPKTAHEFHLSVTARGKPMTFESVLRFLWECGVIVLPLSDAGGFHGAVWKIKERFTMALKQSTQLETRWLYDALHETGHIENGDVTGDVSLIEDQEISPQVSGSEEEMANEWAEDALFDGRSDMIEDACTKACNGRLQKLKSVLPKVAKDFNVNLGSLANHMAYRLAGQNENWWGAAGNLQVESKSPFGLGRDVLFEWVNLSRLNTFDRKLLLRALSEEE